MPEKKKATPVAKPKLKIADLLLSLDEERQACGLTLTDEQLDFIVKLVKASK